MYELLLLLGQVKIFVEWVLVKVILAQVSATCKSEKCFYIGECRREIKVFDPQACTETWQVKTCLTQKVIPFVSIYYKSQVQYGTSKQVLRVKL